MDPLAPGMIRSGGSDRSSVGLPASLPGRAGPQVGSGPPAGARRRPQAPGWACSAFPVAGAVFDCPAGFGLRRRADGGLRLRRASPPRRLGPRVSLLADWRPWATLDGASVTFSFLGRRTPPGWRAPSVRASEAASCLALARGVAVALGAVRRATGLDLRRGFGLGRRLGRGVDHWSLGGVLCRDDALTARLLRLCGSGRLGPRGIRFVPDRQASAPSGGAGHRRAGPAGSRWARPRTADRPGDSRIERSDRAAHRDPDERRRSGDGRPAQALALAADDDRERASEVGLARGQRRIRLGADDPQAADVEVGEGAREVVDRGEKEVLDGSGRGLDADGRERRLPMGREDDAVDAGRLGAPQERPDVLRILERVEGEDERRLATLDGASEDLVERGPSRGATARAIPWWPSNPASAVSVPPSTSTTGIRRFVAWRTSRSSAWRRCGTTISRMRRPSRDERLLDGAPAGDELLVLGRAGRVGRRSAPGRRRPAAPLAVFGHGRRPPGRGAGRVGGPTRAAGGPGVGRARRRPSPGPVARRPVGPVTAGRRAAVPAAAGVAERARTPVGGGAGRGPAGRPCRGPGRRRGRGPLRCRGRTPRSPRRLRPAAGRLESPAGPVGGLAVARCPGGRRTLDRAAPVAATPCASPAGRGFAAPVVTGRRDGAAAPPVASARACAPGPGRSARPEATPSCGVGSGQPRASGGARRAGGRPARSRPAPPPVRPRTVGPPRLASPGAPSAGCRPAPRRRRPPLGGPRGSPSPRSATAGLDEAPPALAVARVLDGDAARGELVAEPVGRRPVARRPRRDPLVEQRGSSGSGRRLRPAARRAPCRGRRSNATTAPASAVERTARRSAG